MILKKLQKYKNFNDIKALRMASQAYDEGSIPFTRSSKSIRSQKTLRRPGDGFP
jgi:hypothetical protein